MNVSPGDVVRAHDHTLRAPKAKRLICVCPERSLFLRINSAAHFPPHLAIQPAECDFIEHLSYIELAHMVYAHPGNVQNGQKLGACSETIKRRIVITLRTGGWMPEDTIDFIEQMFFR